MHSEKAISGSDAIRLIDDRIMEYLTMDTPMFKLILLDFSMPDMDGPEVYLKLTKTMKDSGLRIPYVACCTAYEEKIFERQALAVGMDEFLNKPIADGTIEALLKKVNLI